MEPFETLDFDEMRIARLVVVVGHEKAAAGAGLHGGGSEYSYNSKVAEIMKGYAANRYPNVLVDIVLRDGIGIGGAYVKAKRLNPDACIELHFNAFNGQAQGSETLCSLEEKDKFFANIIQSAQCKVFERLGLSRGVKVISRAARGGQSVYALPGFANCLVEPFFGDNPTEAAMAKAKQSQYAQALVDAFVLWSQKVGLLA